jgi:hypothetical protein
MYSDCHVATAKGLPIDTVRLLRVGSERRKRHRATEHRYELAPPHVGPPPPESVYRTFSLTQGGRRVL